MHVISDTRIVSVHHNFFIIFTFLVVCNLSRFKIHTCVKVKRKKKKRKNYLCRKYSTNNIWAHGKENGANKTFAT